MGIGSRHKTKGQIWLHRGPQHGVIGTARCQQKKPFTHVGINFDKKNGWASFGAKFFTNSSGHPEAKDHFASHRRCQEHLRAPL
jgi:hypothetical protein